MNEYEKKLKMMGGVYGTGIAAMLGLSGAGIISSLKKPKKGLRNPKSPKEITKVVQRAGSKADEVIRSKAPLEKQSNAAQRSFRVTMNASNQYQKLRDNKVIKNIKTMGKLGVIGAIASAMKPKPAGAGSDYTPEQLQAMLNKKK